MMKGMVPLWVKQCRRPLGYLLTSRWVGRLTLLDLAKIRSYLNKRPVA